MATPRLTQRTINALALPALVSNLAEPLIGLADTAIIGHIPENSTEAIGGVGVATGLFFFLFWTFIVLHPAMVATVGRFVGQKRERDLDALIFQLMLFNVGLGIVIWAVSSFFAPELIRLYDVDGLVLQNGVEYFRIRTLGLPIMLVTYLFFGVFQGLQNTRWAMWIALLGGSVNLLLDIILVYGVEGLIPALGVKGAAMGALGGQAVMFVVTVAVLLKRTPYRLKPHWKRHPEFVRTLGVSGNFMIRTVTINVVLFLASRTAAGIGKPELAAHTMINQIWVFSFFLLDGYSAAGQALSGKLLGERDTGNLRFLLKRLVTIGQGVAVVMILGFTALYGVLGHLLSNDPLAVEAFESAFWLLITLLPLGAVAFTYDGILKGMAEATYLRNLMVVAMVVFAATVWALPNELTSVWWAFGAWMIVRCLWPAWFLRNKLQQLETDWA